MLKCFFWSIPVLFLAGCFGAPYRDTAYFDLSPEGVREPQIQAISVMDLQNRSGAGTRFQYRLPDGQVQTDPDHKWILPPGALVSRGVRQAFLPDLKNQKAMSKSIPEEEIAVVNGELLMFEADMKSMSFCLQAKLTVRPNARSKQQNIGFVTRIPLKDKSAAAVVQAVNQAVHELAVQISKVR